MESDAPMATRQGVDVESGQVVRECLRVSLILRQIFQHFSTTELLELSLVNKLWSYEARSLLRDRGTVTTTASKYKPSEHLREFASNFRRLKATAQLLPKCGVTIELGGSKCGFAHWGRTFPTSEVDQACQDILDQLSWKHLAVEFCTTWTEELINCPGLFLMKKVLQEFGPVLEEFALRLPKQRGDFMQQLIEGCCSSFPRFKTLKIKHSSFTNSDYTKLINPLVSHAPNLKVLHISGHVNLRGILLEGSSAVHISDFPFSPFRNEIPEEVIGPLRMTEMELLDIPQALVVERFNRITVGLLESSRKTLNSMQIDALVLAPLTTYGICLENVTTLVVNFDHEQSEITHPCVLRLVKCFDFTRTFPRLKAVQLNCFSHFDFRTDGIEEIVEQAKAAFTEPMPDRAANIQSLSLRLPPDNLDYSMEFLIQMLPNIQKLSSQAEEIPFTRIWDSWLDLKELDVELWGLKSIEKLDSGFCGIFPEEVAQLQEQDEEYLRRVNIVPVMPSITCLKDLRSLKVSFEESYAFCPCPFRRIDDPKFVFFKVTALIAFRRCPDLTVTLTMKDERLARALSHVTPYASVVLEGNASI